MPGERLSSRREKLLVECRAALAARTDMSTLRHLLSQCASHLATPGDHGVSSDRDGQEIEAIARLIEAEAAIWPEDVDRLRSLAQRVRELTRPRFGQSRRGKPGDVRTDARAS
jgi:hypothetical protein